MLQVSLWVRILTAVILLGGILIALPNALPDKVLAKFPKWLPSHTVNLGLDLQGGSYLLLQVDFDQVTRDRAEAMVGDIRAAFRKARIPLTDLNTRNDIVSVRVTDPTRIEEARTLLQSLNPVMGSSVLAVGGKQYDLSEPGNGGFVLRMTDAFKTLTRQQVLDQSIEVVRRRIDELGTREPSIERSGEDRILVQVPGLQDPGQLKEILGKTAKMTFQLVDEAADPNSASVPVGKYAQAALTSLGAWPVVGPRLARAENVRAALALVERGEAPLGIVYATDAAVALKVRIAGIFPVGSHTDITYPFAVLAGRRLAVRLVRHPPRILLGRRGAGHGGHGPRDPLLSLLTEQTTESPSGLSPLQ